MWIATQRRLCHIQSKLRWSLVGFAYVVLGIGALLAASWRGVSPWTHPNPMLSLGSGLEKGTYSALVGIAVAGLVVMTTRALVGRVAFATQLHSELRPLAYRMSTGIIVLLALSSAFGEELLFRGLLQPWIGLFVQALIFGSLHQVGGTSRWVWMTFATLMGLIFGGMYACTGSLVGPLISHALINAINLAHLRNFDPHPEPRRLGGLLSLGNHRSR